MASLRKISQFDSNHRLILALSAAALSFGLVPGHRFSSTHLAIVWCSIAGTVLGLAWITILMANPKELPQLSGMEDTSQSLILFFVSIATLASLLAVQDLTPKQTPLSTLYPTRDRGDG